MRRLETILKITKRIPILEEINKQQTYKLLKDFTNDRKKTYRAVVF